MDLNITIRNIHVNSISTLGSLNVGKAVFLKNRSASIRMPSESYEEEEFTEKELEEAEAELEKVPDLPVFHKD
ncbi:hypothetical protein [Virgibacillus sp. YIM 98842]|jgi:hypothetical protein|uniref:hypothetical protein n=1 Tax=Virgibacillus sp. YIM 98842 TaxID=2663533 RepID=UPI0013DA4F74|nr:hypothetical protein [Virgibacillus sp. YIM 98842]